MRKHLLVLIFSLLFVCTYAQAQDKGFGVGLVLGEPTGISMKIWTGPTKALQFALAWRNEDSFLGSRVTISGDYLWHSFDAIHSTYRFPVYYGVGGTFTSGRPQSDILGVRGVVGIGFWPRKVPLDVFLQVVPTLVLTPSTSVDVNVGLGVRYFFH
jgi:hypothetical protein